MNFYSRRRDFGHLKVFRITCERRASELEERGLSYYYRPLWTTYASVSVRYTVTLIFVVLPPRQGVNTRAEIECICNAHTMVIMKGELFLWHVTRDGNPSLSTTNTFFHIYFHSHEVNLQKLWLYWLEIERSDGDVATRIKIHFHVFPQQCYAK